MKKFLAIIAISSLAVACGSGDKTETKDTTAVTVDTTMAPKMDTTMAPKMDTMPSKMDTTSK